MKTNNIYCIVGPSGSGKTSLVDRLEDAYGFKPVNSYTTRPKRNEDEKGHIFLTPEEFGKLKNLCAYTQFNGYEYGVTEDMIDNCDIYIIDPAGVVFLQQSYKGKKGIIVIGLSVSPEVAKNRMRKRGDEDYAVASRLAHDEKAFKRMADVCNYLIDVDSISIDKVAYFVNNIIESVERK